MAKINIYDAARFFGDGLIVAGIIIGGVALLELLSGGFFEVAKTYVHLALLLIPIGIVAHFAQKLDSTWRWIARCATSLLM